GRLFSGLGKPEGRGWKKMRFSPERWLEQVPLELALLTCTIWQQANILGGRLLEWKFLEYLLQNKTRRRGNVLLKEKTVDMENQSSPQELPVLCGLHMTRLIRLTCYDAQGQQVVEQRSSGTPAPESESPQTARQPHSAEKSRYSVSPYRRLPAHGISPSHSTGTLASEASSLSRTISSRDQ
ncbi:hypothetical protein HAX54_034997, partial [Datura stramonium]|nr:hypothetical protein [Datura stramonium]